MIVVLLAIAAGAAIYWVNSSPSPDAAAPGPDGPRVPAAIVVPATGPEREAAIARIIEMARSAAKKAGVDADAQTVWRRAIDEPAVPAAERRRLIQSLAHEGFGDPRRPSLDDLPLLLTRLELIERLLPRVADSANAAALTETQTLLLEMRARLSGMDAAGPK